MLAHAPPSRWFALPVLAACLSGCADGPVPELRSINPWVTQEWRQDEQLGRTYYQKVDELAQLRSQVASLPAAKQGEIAQQLIAQIEAEPAAALRGELVRTLAGFPGPAAQQAVERAAADEAVTVRRIACRALGERGAPTAVEPLAAALKSDRALDVRLEAARALGAIRDPAAQQALRAALDDNDPALQRAGMDSLAALSGKPYRHSVTAWREYLDGGAPAPVPAEPLALQLRDWWFWY